MKKLLSLKSLALSIIILGAFVTNAYAAFNSVYVLDLNNQGSAFGTTNTYQAKTGTVNGVTWHINAGSCQSSSAVWLGTNSAANYTNLAKLNAGLNDRGDAIAAALGIDVTDEGYYAIAGMNNISNVDMITVQAGATGGAAPSSMWCLYSTNGGATYTILDGVKPSPGTTLVTFTAPATIANAQYAFVWYSSAFGTYRTPYFEFLEESSAPTVEIPSFSPVAGAYTTSQNITIACATEGATIHYTTDGSTPTTSSAVFATPIPVSTTTIIKAFAVKAGMENSAVATGAFFINSPANIPPVAISGVYGGGGNAGAPFQNDYIELFNTTNSEINLEGYTLYYGSATGNATASSYTFVSGATIGAKKFALIKAASGGTNGDPWPIDFDFDSGNAMNLAAASGKVLLFSANVGSPVSLPSLEVIRTMPEYVDYMPFGTTNLAFGTATNVLSATLAATRKYNDVTQVLQYTFDVGADFDVVTLEATTPRNSSYGAPQQVTTPVITPGTSNQYAPFNATITCATVGATIHYTTNGNEPNETSPTYSAPILVNATTTLKAKAFKAGLDDSGVATAVYTFPTEVANIAAFKAANTPTATGLTYKITGNVTFVFRNGRNIYVRDNTGGLLIFDNPTATQIVTNTYNNGDIISGGIIGTCDIYNGLFEMIPVANPAAGTPGTPVQPTTVTMANLLANFADYESQLVKLTEVTFAGGTFGTGGAANIGISQNGRDMICRNHFGTFTGYETDPTTRYDIVGFTIPFNLDRQIAPRGESDINKTEYNIALSASPAGAGTLTGGGIHHYNDQANITATPTAAYNFINWTEGGATITQNPYSFTVTESRTFVANFQIKTYTITSSHGANGTISPLGTFTYNHGANQIYTITPNSGYAIDQVLVNGMNNPAAVASGTYTFSNITANHTISVTFKLGQYILFLDPSTGTVNGSATPIGLPVTYTQPIGSISNAVQPNCIFKGWFLDGELSQQIFPYTLWTYTSNQTALAIFDYPIVATNTNPAFGSITPSGTVNYSLYETAVYTCTPIQGAHITTVVVDGVTVFTGANEETESYTHTFTGIEDYHTIQVGFAMNCYALNPNNVSGTGATITMIPAGCVQYGANAIININTDCYQITQVLVNGVNQGVTSGYSYSIPVTNVSGPLPLIEVSTAMDQFTIMATPLDDPLGIISPSGLATVNCGEDKKYDFITAPGFRVKTLLVDDVSVPVPLSKSYTFYNVRANHSIHAVFEEFPQFIIQFGPSAAQNQGGIVFPTLISNTVNFIAVDSGTVSFPFSIVPAEGYEIDKVFVDNVSNPTAALTGTYSFTNIKANHTIYATFKPVTLTITAIANPNGTISPSGIISVTYGANQTFHVVPNTGYNISEILVDEVPNANAMATGIHTFFNVTENHTISATFAKKTYLITTSAGANGTISPQNPMVPHGNNQTFIFTPQTGYKVDKVWINGIENPAAAQAGLYTFLNVTQEHTIAITFTKIKFTITATHTTGGKVTPAGIIEVYYDEHSPILVFVANEGFSTKSVIVDGVNNAQAIEDGLYRFMNVTENHAIHVVFQADINTITATATQGGYISPSGVINVPNGETKVFTFAAVGDFELVRVIIDGINDPDAVQNGYYVFFDVTANHTIAAQFEKKKYTVSLPEVEGVLFTPTGGSTSPVEHGGKFTFTVELQAGYTQSSISIYVNSTQIYPAAGIYTINNIIINQIVTVNGVELNKYKIVAKANSGGTISPAGTFMVTHGENKTFEITSNVNYIIDDVVVNGTSAGAVQFYTFTNVTADATIEANFLLQQGININDETSIQIFSNYNVITILNENLISIKQIDIMDMHGRIIWTGQAIDVKTDITLNVAKGIYGVRIATTHGQQHIAAKVVIN